MTTPTSPNAPLNGRDLLRSNGLPVEGPILWGRPVAGGSPGVFVVELPAAQPKVSIDPTAIREWLGRVPDLRLDGKRPSVAELQTRLASFWLPEQAIIFIGSSQKSVSVRLTGMYKTPLGERRPQSVGYWLKTLHDLAKARIWWAPTADPELYEDTLIEQFLKNAGALPYAVLATASGQRHEHGITTPLHDSEAGRPPKITKVTVLPDANEAEMAASAAPRVGSGKPTRPLSLRTRKSTPRKLTPKPMPTTGPSAIEIPVVRRSAKVAYISRNSSAPTHLTPEGLVTLQNELEELTERRRPEVISRIKSARELGDLSENADYEAARKEQSFLEGRVQQLEQMIKSAVIIETEGTGSVVVLGSTVVIETDRHGEETFTIVGSAEADAAAGKISYTSPIGRALMGRRAGETVHVVVPAGTHEYTVTKVR